MALDEFEWDDDGNLVQAEYPPETVEFVEDEFERHVAAARARDAGRKPSDNAGSAWTRLMAGKTIGKKVMLYQEVLGYGPVGSDAGVPVNMFELGAPDNAALDLCITLLPPQNVDLNGGSLPADVAAGQIQSLTGEAYSNLDQQGAGCPHNPVALIEWGIGGVQSVAEVDFMNGCTLNIRASFVRISAFLEIVDTSFSWLTALSAFVGPASGSNNVAQRTYDLREVLTPDAANQQTGPVPYFAKEFALYSRNDNSRNPIPVSLIFRRDQPGALIEIATLLFETTGQAVGYTQQVINPLRFGERYPVPNGAMSYVLTNISSAAIEAENLVNPVIVFFLSI